MSVERLIQMSNLGLMGSVEVSSGCVSVRNGFNQIAYDEEIESMVFSVQETLGKYGEISFSVNEIEDISGCEDTENPEEWLNINIQMADKTAIKINILY